MAQMTPTDLQPFLEALNEMGEFFSDELSELRQRSYWRVMEGTCSLAEWRYACTQAMARETFHKVPLPAQLMDYVREYRRTLAGTNRQRDEMPDGSHTAAQLLQLRESLATSAEVAALIASVWPEEQERHHRPRLQTQRHLTEEELHFEPAVDAETAKRKAREQLRQLRDEEDATDAAD